MSLKVCKVCKFDMDARGCICKSNPMDPAFAFAILQLSAGHSNLLFLVAKQDAKEELSLFPYQDEPGPFRVIAPSPIWMPAGGCK